MTKADVHVKMDPGITVTIRSYAKANGLSFTAALSTLAARGLRAEGWVIMAAPADLTAEREHQNEEGT
jgi:hypothetical protein